jgi:hypothetical protein
MRMGSLLPLLFVAAGAHAATALPAAAASAAAGAAAPAEWRSWDLIVDLQDLPQAYTCDELWYRFHDLLQVLGARPDMQILTYHCGSSHAQATRSPRVQLQFELPNPLSESQARYADMSAVRTTVRIGPGQPHSFTAGDCELLKQINSQLLAALPVRVVGARLSCPAAGGAARQPFALRVQTLVPHS